MVQEEENWLSTINVNLVLACIVGCPQLGMLDLGECLLLDADYLPSEVGLSSVQISQPSSKNLGLMRYRGDLSGHLVSTFKK